MITFVKQVNEERNKRLLFLLAILFFLPAAYSNAQAGKTTDFYDAIKNFDLSVIWKNDSLISVNLDVDSSQKQVFCEPHMIEFPEPIGFLGGNYQRYYIHYSAARKSYTNPYLYEISGKTKKKGDLCMFKGSIEIKQAKKYIIHDKYFPDQGYVICEVRFFESCSPSIGGWIKGELKTDWYIDSARQIHYNNLNEDAEGYCNNQFTGKWNSYRKSGTKPCNWGDMRIPDCGDLDIGKGEFSPNEKYLKNGWQNYADAIAGGSDTVKINKARAKENKEWWK